ncbi:OTU domain-containing protein 6B [Paramicrosporidium saccamoebae]|uniref:OTU domain-containing protein 6B n=1 Tax=Paramicrosporidium saccamoebae TaxID=1246581 RepID=A0A2H9TFB6_9FUNG|nr:OTU domain-containing protein 6B [Paramicrosporidium saccamoebae]
MEDSVDVEAYDETSEQELVDIEDPFSARRQELKELRTRLVAARRAVKNADKKQKKSIHEEVSTLEALLESKKEALETDERLAAGAALVMERTHENERAAAARAKRQAKKEMRSEEDAKRKQEAQAIAAQMPQLGRLEREAFETVLLTEQLEIFHIDPDGSCLFNALSHQLKVRYSRNYDQSKLRDMAAEYILGNEIKYAGFLEEPLEDYCERLRGNDLWGGHLELDALSEALSLPIVVYQASSPPMTFGSDRNDSPLRIWYLFSRFFIACSFQKYAYSLGEHYDSLIDRSAM